MTDIRYVAPRTLDEAIGAFAAAGSAARIMAGGTDLLVQMRSGMVRPGLIVGESDDYSYLIMPIRLAG